MIADKENAGTNPNLMLFSPPKQLKGFGPSSGLGGVKGGKQKVQTLQCERYGSGITMEFGRVEIDSNNTLKFAMYNPDQTKTAVMEIDSVLETKGFGIVLGNGTETQYKLGPLEKGHGVITWNPTSNMTISKKMFLKFGDKARLEITVKGIAGTGKVSHNTLFG